MLIEIILCRKSVLQGIENLIYQYTETMNTLDLMNYFRFIEITMRLYQLLKKNTGSLVAALAGCILIYKFTSTNGVGISPDSIVYMSTARNLYHGLGYYAFNGNPMVDFPIFYPTFLSCILFLSRTDVLVFAPFLNGILFGIVVFLSGYILQKFVTVNRWYKWMVLSIIVLSPSLIEIYTMLWSETLFILLTVLFFLSFKNYYQNHSLPALLQVAMVTALAFLTRYAGITLIGTGGLLLLVNVKAGWRKKITHLLIFSLVSVSLVFMNLLRNAALTGTLTGKRQLGITPFYKNVEYMGSVYCDWLSLLQNQYKLAALICILALFFFCIMFLLQNFSMDYYHSYEKILMAFFVVYSAFILVSATLSRYETINNRLLSPAYIPFILGCSYLYPVWLQFIRQPWKKMLLVAGLLLLFFSFQYTQIQSDLSYYQDIRDDGIPGYAETYWQTTPVVHLMRTDTLLARHSNHFYSNQNHAVYFFTGFTTKTIPERVHIQEVKEFYQLPDFYIIWIKEDDNPDLLSIKEISQHKKIEIVKKVEDGFIFLCTNYSEINKH